ncbi:MAG: N-acetylmuramoyl-L-alanine amidase, partial [Actinobacteria bacterium]|nr:N-acetylmuramoyl-L-alanine amidase [Actinomycetota bacterium]
MRTLGLGDRGKEVSDVQQRLFALRFDLGGEGLDGFLGPHTVAAVK